VPDYTSHTDRLLPSSATGDLTRYNPDRVERPPRPGIIRRQSSLDRRPLPDKGSKTGRYRQDNVIDLDDLLKRGPSINPRSYDLDDDPYGRSHPPIRGHDGDEIVIRRDEREYDRPARAARRSTDDHYPGRPKSHERERDVTIREREDVRYRDGPDILREDYGRTSAGPLVLRNRETEALEYTSRPRRRSPSIEPEPRRVEREEIVIRRGSPSPERPPPRRERGEIIIRRGSPSPERPPPRRERGEIIIRTVSPSPERRPLRRDRDEVIIRRNSPNSERIPPRRERDFDHEEVIIRRLDHDSGRGLDRDREEVITRHHFRNTHDIRQEVAESEEEPKALERERLLHRIERARRSPPSYSSEASYSDEDEDLDRDLRIQEAKIKLDQLRVKRDDARRTGDTQTATDLTFYAIPDVAKRIELLEAARLQADAENNARPGISGDTRKRREKGKGVAHKDSEDLALQLAIYTGGKDKIPQEILNLDFASDDVPMPDSRPTIPHPASFIDEDISEEPESDLGGISSKESTWSPTEGLPKIVEEK
jgi:hypothetical protein